MKQNIALINKDKIDKTILFEQYRIICESADHITEKRQNMNNFYLTINSFILTVAGYFSTNNFHNLIPFFASGIGGIICVIWSTNIDSFKKLNSAKFKVIHELENHLPAQIFKKEEEYLYKYHKLTSIEKKIPYVFLIFYIILLVMSLIRIM